MAEDTKTGGTRGLSRRVQTESQFRKCNSCGGTLFINDLHKMLEVCKDCGHHFQITAKRRIEITLDPDTFVELFNDIEAEDPLQFKGRRSYLERIREAQARTGLKDAVVCGEGKICGRDVVVAVMDFQFIGGSMGSVVGEKITRAVERATELRKPVIIVCCSGGARMDEGAFSLMQMAKTSAALYRHDQAGLMCITLLTHPTLAGVSASFAFLGDVIIAEPKAMIGFTGARVIFETIKKKLPPGFQESEFLLEHGQIDMVVERKNLRGILAKLVAFTEPQDSGIVECGLETADDEGDEEESSSPVLKTRILKKPGAKKTVVATKSTRRATGSVSKMVSKKKLKKK